MSTKNELPPAGPVYSLYPRGIAHWEIWRDGHCVSDPFFLRGTAERVARLLETAWLTGFNDANKANFERSIEVEEAVQVADGVTEGEAPAAFDDFDPSKVPVYSHKTTVFEGDFRIDEDGKALADLTQDQLRMVRSTFLLEIRTLDKLIDDGPQPTMLVRNDGRDSF